jgi:branched-chain amino acid transport system ATP-binding protein
MTLLSVRNVTMRFGGVTAVEDVSLDLAENRLLGFIGPNGAGKTTLMRIITGVLRPQQGSVIFDGQDVTRWPVDRRIRAGLAIGQQIVRPLRSLSLTDNVALAAGVGRMTSPLVAPSAPGRASCWSWSALPTPPTPCRASCRSAP